VLYGTLGVHGTLSRLFCKHISDNVADAPELLAVSFFGSTYQTIWQMHQSCWQSAIL